MPKKSRIACMLYILENIKDRPISRSSRPLESVQIDDPLMD